MKKNLHVETKVSKQKLSENAKLFILMLKKRNTEMQKYINKLKMKKNFPRTARAVTSTTEDILSL